ncbi:hypothetical protein HBI56_012140 [Parastagonospora nodorum]|uniref:Uncharacterized protein n=1 Tax=Phaeosphaeria nodorum (strain SN15 / ATCC MYA-4574 / FGSC 10173) TaxID=321614 RepID=A0A7U2EQE2_PHANO|nr:hypothetical protein HBH56_009460 [Parastagonospora nodorum]QRC90667.1 hypothetical protein JI435_400500 [Parastagonospora nodorum SN15]KAH3934709.1 hypothetical protein HBH54_042750 [Parastagonospora nodorum]KAH3943744.1 hypothetical protein HBH53_171210 [Parastagonospora nodorum]KAH3987042.1 hypothetical protein HBH51_013850 [Parastagonospora nodorum]
MVPNVDLQLTIDPARKPIISVEHCACPPYSRFATLRTNRNNMDLLRSLDCLHIGSSLDVCGICVVLATGRSLTYVPPQDPSSHNFSAWRTIPLMYATCISFDAIHDRSISRL